MPNKSDYQKQMQKERRRQQLQKARKKFGDQKRSINRRHNDIPVGVDWDEFEAEGVQRIMPRGSAEQRKMLEKAIAQAPDVEEEKTGIENAARCGLTGTVIETAGELCRVQMGERQITCSLRGMLKQQLTGFSNLLAVGDRVLLSLDGKDRGVVEQVLPRRGVLARTFSPDMDKNSSLLQLVAANIEALLVVASWRQPHFWPVLVDRYLITAERNHIRPMLCINKIDLAKDQGVLQSVTAIYRDVGTNVLLTSALSGEGVEQLRAALSRQTTVLAGLSGAGKSSLLSLVQPGLKLRANDIGQSGRNKNQGRHTTTAACLYPLDGGGAVIDTPGIREFGLAGVKPIEVAEYYPEMVALRHLCQFSDCLHRDEPGCAVRQEVGSGRVSNLRYESYLKIINELGV